MDICVFILFVLSCVYVEALLQPDPPSKESYRLCIGLGKLKRSWPNKRPVGPKEEEGGKGVEELGRGGEGKEELERGGEEEGGKRRKRRRKK
jgi:hypothetical protein